MARSRSRPAPARAPPRPAPSAPSRSTPAQAPHHNQQNAPAHHQPSSGGGLLSGFASTVAQGFAFGTGSAIAHRAVGAAASAIGGSGEQQQGGYAQEPAQQQQQQYGAYPQQQQAGPVNACQVDVQNFQACLSHNPGNVDACSFLYEALQQCQRNSQFASNQM